MVAIYCRPSNVEIFHVRSLIQVMTEEQAKTHTHNPFDVTKVWPKADYPLIEVGVMERVVIRKTTSQR